MSKQVEAWFKETIVWCDGPVFSLLHGAIEDEFYLSLALDKDFSLYLCIPVSKEKIDEYTGQDYVLFLRLYRLATDFYTNKYEDFDGEIYILREIARSDIEDDWWPGEE